MASETFLRLCTRAPRMSIESSKGFRGRAASPTAATSIISEPSNASVCLRLHEWRARVFPEDRAAGIRPLVKRGFAFGARLVGRSGRGSFPGRAIYRRADPPKTGAPHGVIARLQRAILALLSARYWRSRRLRRVTTVSHG